VSPTPFNPLEYQATLLLARQRKPKVGTIKHGDTGAAVRALQRQLTQKDYAVEQDGVFGPQTQKALRQFQKDHGAKVDGIVGQETLGKLERAKGRPTNAADPSISAMRQVVGNPGAPVRSRMQEQQRAAAPVTENRGTAVRRSRSGSTGAKGPKGPNTGTGERASQDHPIGTTDPNKARGRLQAPANGVSNDEFNRLHPRGGTGTAEGGKFVKKGDSGKQVQTIQDRINKADGARLKKDGEFGPKTQQAVRDFQARAGIAQDGIVGPITLGAMRRRITTKRQRKTTRPAV
jgi:peptidoglycan hydrolase-like protein with peptidoglycan-binding domain